MDAFAQRQASVQTKRHQGLSNRLIFFCGKKELSLQTFWKYNFSGMELRLFFFYQARVFLSIHTRIGAGVAPDSIMYQLGLQ